MMSLPNKHAERLNSQLNDFLRHTLNVFSAFTGAQEYNFNDTKSLKNIYTTVVTDYNVESLFLLPGVPSNKH